MEELAHSDEPRGISEMARALKMDKSAVQRTFESLRDLGYLERHPGTGRYRLGLAIWEIGSLVIARHEIRRLIHPILRYGAKASGFTAFLTWADFPYVVYLDKVEGVQGHTLSAEPGNRVPIHLTASGKAALAFMPQEKLEALVEVPQDSSYQQKSTSEPLSLVEELAAIRERTYAVSHSGSVTGVNSVASPVWHTGSVPFGSIVLTADATNMPASEMAHFGTTVTAMADEASWSLGGTARGVQTPP
jgi:DNA-binding IclR family transcriptional regulator